MYDAIVIGARCAGASTALLLARKGHKVLLLDRATFPSDIPHGHFIHMHGPRRLAEWGLLERVLDTGCPPITTFTLDVGDFPLTGHDLEANGVPLGLGPRRHALDHVLVRAAVEAGAELRDGYPVQDFVAEDGRVTGVVGRNSSERATIVVGADGRNSSLARYVQAPLTQSAPTLSCWYFSYWSRVPLHGLEIRVAGRRATFVHPTNDGLTTLFAVFPIEEMQRVRSDIEGEVTAVIEGQPQLAEAVRAGERVERFYGGTQLPNFMRKPYGPGWALVGDAGSHKDPFMALGVCDALRDAEFLADAIHEGLSGEATFEEALARYEQRRDEATLPWFQINLGMARLEGPPPEDIALRAALRADQEDINTFFMAREGMVPPETFFNADNLARIMGAPA